MTYKNKIQSCLAEYPDNFKDIGKLKNYQIKLHIKTEAIPVGTNPRSKPYHLRDQASTESTNKLLRNSQ